MGAQSDSPRNADLRMKLLIALCALGAALVAAEPQYWAGYYGGYYRPYYGGDHYYGKRSADAEPEPQYYRGYYGRGYYGGYRGYYRGKRSADAEPKAEAE